MIFIQQHYNELWRYTTQQINTFYVLLSVTVLEQLDFLVWLGFFPTKMSNSKMHSVTIQTSFLKQSKDQNWSFKTLSDDYPQILQLLSFHLKRAFAIYFNGTNIPHMPSSLQRKGSKKEPYVGWCSRTCPYPLLTIYSYNLRHLCKYHPSRKQLFFLFFF